ncbi:hypothetical protein [Brucella intermedia]|uniref:hypothetical protein n=1 Tax=Brucella intermedia TaxID=94625 RepID=UPI0007C73318|nr:hypothetical protein [Brucella intermedia]OAE39610.1 hypothetical protein A7J42_13940 [Brucella intermedia]
MTSIVEFENASHEDKSFRNYLQELIDREIIHGGSAEGITRQIIAQGHDSLSDKQKFVFERDVMSAHGLPVCEMCGESIAYENALYAIDECEGRCSSCQHSYDKFMED